MVQVDLFYVQNHLRVKAMSRPKKMIFNLFSNSVKFQTTALSESLIVQKVKENNPGMQSFEYDEKENDSMPEYDKIPEDTKNAMKTIFEAFQKFISTKVPRLLF